MPQDASLDAPPTQHRVLRQISEALVRTLARGMKEVTGREIPVHLAYQHQGEGARKVHLTAIQYWVERVPDRNPDRVLCKTPEGDEFHRAPPLILIARYLITPWAPSPEDQELLGLAMRLLYDTVTLEPSGEGEEDAVHWEDKPTPELVPRFTLEEARIVCECLRIPLRPSARYDISFRLDSERKTPVKRVKERIVDYKKLDG